MRAGTSRDGRQQSRLIRGNKDGFEICTVDHQKGGKVRLDATITYRGDTNEVGVYAHEDEAFDHDNYFKVYAPSAGDKLHPPDDGFRRYNSDGNIERKTNMLNSRSGYAAAPLTERVVIFSPNTIYFFLLYASSIRR